jgi:hypothetical protein
MNERHQRSRSGRFPGGLMTLVAVNFFMAYALLLADDVLSSVDEE